MVTRPATHGVHATDPPPPRLALFVDPHDDTRLLYKIFLSSHRYLVEEAADGCDALAKAVADPPDIVVTETALPGIGGFDFCELLRHDPDNHDVPIIVLTSDARDENRQRAHRSGADVVLAKPCLPADLLNHMQQLQPRPAEPGARAKAAVATAPQPVVEAAAIVSECRAVRRALSKSLRRYETTTPRVMPPALMCPVCSLEVLEYIRSFIGGVSEKLPEQWDQLKCRGGCGTFTYRHRTRKLIESSD